TVPFPMDATLPHTLARMSRARLSWSLVIPLAACLAAVVLTVLLPVPPVCSSRPLPTVLLPSVVPMASPWVVLNSRPVRTSSPSGRRPPPLLLPGARSRAASWSRVAVRPPPSPPSVSMVSSAPSPTSLLPV
ncbi:hypothetical protein BG003_003577, partial [Podila horticola]